MKNKRNENGFSLVELLVVVTVAGIIAALGVPLFKKAIVAAENTSTFSTAKVMVQEQVNFYAQNARYARLDELNAKYNGGFGLTQGNEIKKGKYTFSMEGDSVPPSNEELKKNFTIRATRTIDGADAPYIILVDASGDVIQMPPN